MQGSVHLCASARKSVSQTAVSVRGQGHEALEGGKAADVLQDEHHPFMALVGKGRGGQQDVQGSLTVRPEHSSMRAWRRTVLYRQRLR